MHVIIGFKHWNGVNNLLLLIFMTFSVVSFRFDFFPLSSCRKTRKYEKPKLIISNFTCHRYKFEEKKNIFNSVFVS